MEPFMRASLAAIALAGLLAGCASVNRVDPNTVTDLSGNWNDTDSRLVAEEMIVDCLSRPWLTRATAAKGGKPPVLIVGTVRNRSSEHIAITTFTKDLERQLINDGRVEFVASKEERSEVREEREDQQMQSSAETMKRMRNETGADFMLIGNIDQINDSKGGTSAKVYQVNLELVNLETNQKVWLGTKDIKKMVKRGLFGK
jgi:penicillin-binding protein activator